MPAKRRDGGRAQSALLVGLLVLAVAGSVFVLSGAGPTAHLSDEGDPAAQATAESVEAAALSRLAAGDTAHAREAAEAAAAAEAAKNAPTFSKAEGLYGRVIDSHERPIPGATVSLRSIDPDDPMWWAPSGDAPPVAQATTDEKGEFLVGPAPETRLRLRAEAPGYARTEAYVPTRGAKVDVVLDRGGALLVKVRDRKNAPVVGADVRYQAGAFAVSGTTDAAGEAKLEGIASGMAMLRVVARGFAPVSINNPPVEPEKTVEKTVVLGAGVAVAGRVVDDRTSVPVEGVEVVARSPWDRTVPESESVVSDAQGRFEIPSAGGPGEQVQISGKKDGFGPAAAQVQLQPAGGAPQEVELRLGAAATVKGRVADAEGRSVAGARVLYPMTMGANLAGLATTSDEEGRFELALPPGMGKEWETTVVATSKGKGVGVAQITSKDLGGSDVVLGGVGSVSGTVNGGDGKPVEGASVTVSYDWNQGQQQNGTSSSKVQPWILGQVFQDPRIASLSATTNAEGQFRISDIPASAYVVSASWGLERTTATTQVKIRSGATETVTLSVGAGQTIEGHVLDTDGKPIPGAYVQGSDPAKQSGNERRSGYARADVDGYFVMRGVVGVAWKLTASAPGYTQKEENNVAPGAKNVEMRLAPLGWVEGVVFGEDGPYAGSFTVRLQPLSNERGAMRFRSGGMWYGGSNEETFVSPDGSFRMRGVTAGGYRVDVQTQENLIPNATPEVTVSDGRAAGPVQVRLTRGGVVVGTVVEDGTRAPVTPAWINVSIRGPATTGGLTYGWSQVDARGRFTVQGLAGGTYVVNVNTSSGATAEQEIRVSPGRTTEQEIVVFRLGALLVRVFDAEGRAIEGATVNVMTGRGNYLQPNWEALRKEGVDMSRPDWWNRITQTDEQGQNFRSHVPPGAVQVNVYKQGYAHGPATSTQVASDRTTEVTVTLAVPNASPPGAEAGAEGR